MASKYTLLKEFLRETIFAAEALGATISPDGEYAFVQDPTAEPNLGANRLCLLGAVELVTGIKPRLSSFQHGWLDRVLGLEKKDIDQLESGFCGWVPTGRKTKFFALGRELRREVLKRNQG
jgi:hypothetical protein